MTAAERRKKILDDIAAAAKLARREPSAVQLIAVSKTRSAGQIEALRERQQIGSGEKLK